MSGDDASGTDSQVSCPGCGRAMCAGWAQVKLLGLPAEGHLMWSDQDPERNSLGYLKPPSKVELLTDGRVCQCFRCSECSSVYLRLRVEPAL